MKRILLCIVVLALLGAACDSSQPPQSSPTSAAPGPSFVESDSSPSATPTLEELPLNEGRLEGTYNVKLFTTSNTFDSKPAKGQVFHLEPKCDVGACDTTLTGRMSFEGAGSDRRKEAGAQGSFLVRLRSLGKKYEGYDTDFFASCDTEPDKDRWTFNITVDKAVFIEDAWTALKWSGTWTRASDFGGACRPGHLKAVIRGTLKVG